jgi:hypothetical protein
MKKNDKRRKKNKAGQGEEFRTKNQGKEEAEQE